MEPQKVSECRSHQESIEVWIFHTFWPIAFSELPREIGCSPTIWSTLPSFKFISNVDSPKEPPQFYKYSLLLSLYIMLFRRTISFPPWDELHLLQEMTIDQQGPLKLQSQQRDFRFQLGFPSSPRPLHSWGSLDLPVRRIQMTVLLHIGSHTSSTWPLWWRNQKVWKSFSSRRNLCSRLSQSDG